MDAVEEVRFEVAAVNIVGYEVMKLELPDVWNRGEY